VAAADPVSRSDITADEQARPRSRVVAAAKTATKAEPKARVAPPAKKAAEPSKKAGGDDAVDLDAEPELEGAPEDLEEPDLSADLSADLEGDLAAFTEVGKGGSEQCSGRLDERRVPLPGEVDGDAGSGRACRADTLRES